MNFDTAQLAAVVDELNKLLVGSRIDKVHQPEPLELIIGFYKNGSHRNLFVSAGSEGSRIHLIKQRGRPNPQIPPAFCMLLRKYLEGTLVESIAQPFGFCERVICVQLRGGPADRTKLWFEIMGRQSNVILTNDSGMILGSIKRVTSAMSRMREIHVGIPYSPPPKQLGYKRDPMDPLSSISIPDVQFAGRDEAEQWLTSTFKGVGTVLAKEAAARMADGPPSSQTAWYGLNELLTMIRTGEFTPVVFRGENGQVLGAYPFRLKSIPPQDQTEALSMSDALEYAFSKYIEADVLARERTALLVSLRKAHKAAVRQILDVREGLINADNSNYLRESGELLLANINQYIPGSTSITVPDLFAAEQGDVRTISLDTSMTINENAQRYFRKFQKARDSRESLTARQAALETTAAELECAIADAEAASTAEQISAVAAHLSQEIRQTQPSATGKPQASSAFDGHKIKMYRSPDGWEILVGENSTSNDFLTTKLASPSDIWLHARAIPSAHAVIRTQNRPASVSTAALILAAEQVAKRSSAKHARLVSVDYTLKKYVRKPRGSAPGQVTYSNEKTLDVVAASD